MRTQTVSSVERFLHTRLPPGRRKARLLHAAACLRWGAGTPPEGVAGTATTAPSCARPPAGQKGELGESERSLSSEPGGWVPIRGLCSEASDSARDLAILGPP